MKKTKTGLITKKIEHVGYCPKCGHDRLLKVGFTTNKKAKQRYQCQSCNFTTTTPSAEPPKDLKAVPMRKVLPAVKRYVITSAQNATPIDKPTFETLKQVAKYYDAELVVIPGRYKNPTSQWNQNNKDHDWWDEAVVPYLCDGRINLNDRLVMLGDVKIQWAAQTPLNGMDSLTKGNSGIVGHGSRGLRSIATPQYKYPKIMLTTGACTVSNYVDCKRGKIAEFNHCLGGLIVEIDGDAFYVRQLNATDEGHIIDLDMEFTPQEAYAAKPALSIALGDLHYPWPTPQVILTTFTAPDSLANVINPQYLIWHDVIDFHSRNHHHKEDWITQFGKAKFKIDSVRAEIENAIHFINEHTAEGCKSIIVSSNHDRAVARWLREVDFRKDPVNAEFYIDCAKRAMQSVKVTDGGIEYEDLFISIGKELASPNVQFLKQGESFILERVEYGFHGDLGPNGARGTTKNLSRIGVKVTKGHSHNAEIVDGCYSAGKFTGMLEYENGGPSNHTNSHVIQYSNGKRAIIFIIDGRFCLPRPEVKNEGAKK